jgi:uncharacterized protein (TIGR02145 family)
MVQYENGATNTTSWNPVPTGNIRGICPINWHLPTDEEWKTMEMELGMSQSQADATNWRGNNEGGELKEAGTTHWTSPNTGATNTSGFTGLPGGYLSYNYTGNTFVLINDYAAFWSRNENGTTNGWYRALYKAYDKVYRTVYGKSFGFSVRCVKD